MCLAEERSVVSGFGAGFPVLVQVFSILRFELRACCLLGAPRPSSLFFFQLAHHNCIHLWCRRQVL
jgi:hypothetical protein